MSLLSNGFRGVKQPKHESGFSHSKARKLRTCGALSPFPNTYSCKGQIYEYQFKLLKCFWHVKEYFEVVSWRKYRKDLSWLAFEQRFEGDIFRTLGTVLNPFTAHKFRTLTSPHGHIWTQILASTWDSWLDSLDLGGKFSLSGVMISESGDTNRIFTWYFTSL